MKPKGALSWTAAVKLAKGGHPFYLVYMNRKDEDFAVIEKHWSAPEYVNWENPVEKEDAWVRFIPAKSSWVYRHGWFGGEQRWGWVFSNYFHALAFSLKLKNPQK